MERKLQHILNVARALMFQSNLPKHFWSYAIKHAAFLINCVPSPVIKNKTSFWITISRISWFFHDQNFWLSLLCINKFFSQKFDAHYVV